MHAHRTHNTDDIHDDSRRTPRPAQPTAPRRWGVALALFAVVVAVVFSVCDPPPGQAFCGGEVATIVGSSGDDTLNGTPGHDVIVGDAGNDTIDALGGDDVICGDRDVAGNDTIKGGSGTDWVSFDESRTGGTLDLAAGTSRVQGVDSLSGIENVRSGPAADDIHGSAVANRIVVGRDDTVEGGAGDDVFEAEPACTGSCPIYLSYASAAAGVVVDARARTATGGAGNDTYTFDPATVIGSELGDRLTCATTAACSLQGRGAADVLVGSSADDDLDGGAGDDTLTGNGGTDRASFASRPAAVTVDLATGRATGQGADTLLGIEGVVGTSSADRITGGAAPCELFGGQGDDRLTAGPEGCRLVGSGGNDTLTGGVGPDRIEGDDQFDTGTDIVHAGAGDDSLRADLGDDLLDGGPGQDTVSYLLSSSGITADLAAGTVRGGLGSDTLQQVENLEGTGKGDSLTGSDAANAFWGFAGNDILLGLGGDDFADGGNGADIVDGGAGNDFLEGGRDADRMFGGPDRDRLAFRTETAAVFADLTTGEAATASGVDHVLDFEDLMGSNSDDVLVGDSGPNRISGAPGRDSCDGRGGEDSFLDCE